MEFNYRFFGNSEVSNDAGQTDISFAPDTLRDPTYFVADINKHIPFREAISALHDVVVSDLRFKPRDKTEYKQWLQQHEQTLLAEFLESTKGERERLRQVREELAQMNRRYWNAMGAFNNAQRKYFDYLYTHDFTAWLILDPVITVNPDEVFFECFSKDESTYGRLACDFEVFDNIREQANGTTNIDYSDALYQEFQKIRSYKNTQFRIEPGGFQVQTGHEDEYVEEKIDLPDSWVRGFLQVSSAMTLPAYCIDMDPMDIHNICFLLRRFKEKHGPRSIRFCLRPGQPVELIFEPWNKVLTCPRSRYLGDSEQEIRIWGRRRLLTLERLIPIADRFRVFLLGSGMPSFYIAEMGLMRFTLGLSGWTANDWSRSGHFDLMAPRTEVDDLTKVRIYKALKETWCESPASLAARLNLDRDVVMGALGIYTQAGKVIYDLTKQVYRIRELSREPLPLEKLRFENEREAKASRFVNANLVQLQAPERADHRTRVRGQVRDNVKKYDVSITIDDDERLIEAECGCFFFSSNRLRKGPCEHILAARMQLARR